MLGVGERVARVVGVVLRELFEAAACLVPALRRGGERLVILELQFGRGGLAVQRALIFLHRARALAALREPPRVVDGLVAQTDSPRRRPEFVDDSDSSARPPSGARDIAARRAVLAVGEHHAHAEQRIGLLRIDAQHLLPRLLGEVAALMRSASTCPDRSAR